MFRWFILTVSLLPCLLWGISHDLTKHKSNGKKLVPRYDYARNPYISDEVWEKVKPYLLPSNHPLKPRLDKIFRKQRVTSNLASMKKAGFSRVMRRNYSFTVVSPHPALPGYFIKMYTDEEPHVLDYEKWIHRIEGAKAIRRFINLNNLQKVFKVPNKWIYPLPPEPLPPEGSFRKNFILVAEDMQIYRRYDNDSRWKKYMSKERMKDYYKIVHTLGLKDNVLPFNCPFCLDGRQAFIDTEYHHEWPIGWERLMPYLADSVSAYFRDHIDEATRKN